MITTAIAVTRWRKHPGARDDDPIEVATTKSFVLFALLMASVGVMWSFADADVDRFDAQIDLFEAHPPQSIMEREMRAEAYAERAERTADRKHLAWCGFILWLLWEATGTAINLLAIGVPVSWSQARQRWRKWRHGVRDRVRVAWKEWRER